MINELYERSAIMHGHKCPGLAIGVRAGAEALALLDVTERGHNLYCIAESRACYQDGIQTVFRTTLGNGNLELRERGKAAFNFYDRATGKSIRLCAKPLPKGMNKQQMIDFILTAPVEQVFSQTALHFDVPPETFSGKKKAVCSRCGEECGEPYFRIVDGQVLCMDCVCGSEE